MSPATSSLPEPAAPVERPLWQMVAILYVGLLVIVLFVIALVFTVPLLF